jgi:ribonuclease VapC
MVVDTSALVAILDGEPGRRAYIEAIEAADARRLSAATFVEASIVVEARRGPEGTRDLEYGDCFAYALAITLHEPLLFTGGDFRHTDVAACEV